MTDVTVIDEERADETPQVSEPDDARDAIRQARSLIPVGPSGATPMNFAQQVDVAKTMAQSRFSIPQFLCGNAGDCLAIIDIASRANLSPYMVATMCYLEPKSKRLSFMSQLYHALLIQSRMIVGDLDVTYDGEGESRTCTVTGKLRSDGKVRTHTSPPLSQVRPKKNDEGTIKGSPLWQKKPDVQLFYDTSRDWTRIFCPTATLGIFAPEEFEETPIGPDHARDVTGLAQRISDAPKAGEGYTDGHADRELSQIAPAGQKIIDAEPAKGTAAPADGASAGDPAPAATTEAPRKERTTRPRKPAVTDMAEPTRTTTLERDKPLTSKAVQRIADRAEASAKAKRGSNVHCAKCGTVYAIQPDRCDACGCGDFKSLLPVPVRSALKTPADYIAYAKAWIDISEAFDPAMAQWDGESELRNSLKVPIKDRTQLQSRIDIKFGA